MPGIKSSYYAYLAFITLKLSPKLNVTLIRACSNIAKRKLIKKSRQILKINVILLLLDCNINLFLYIYTDISFSYELYFKFLVS